jgi:hypothetical protein
LRPSACGNQATPPTLAQVGLVQQPRALDLALQRFGQTARQHRVPILAALAIAYHDLALREKSTSFTRRRRHSIRRIPVPYNRLAINHARPSMPASRRCTSLVETTVGKRRPRRARATSSIQGKSTANTLRYRNSKADKA